MAAESGRLHRKLVVWQKSMALVKTVYELTRGFPKEEIYGFIKSDAEKCGFNL